MEMSGEGDRRRGEAAARDRSREVHKVRRMRGGVQVRRCHHAVGFAAGRIDVLKPRKKSEMNKTLNFKLPKNGGLEFRQNFAKNLLNVTSICE